MIKFVQPNISEGRHHRSGLDNTFSYPRRSQRRWSRWQWVTTASPTAFVSVYMYNWVMVYYWQCSLSLIGWFPLLNVLGLLLIEQPDEPGWNLMPLFSLSDLHILSDARILPSFFLLVQQGRVNYLPLPWPPPQPSLTCPCFPPRLVFQPVSLFNGLIPPSLIKHDHRPCVSHCAPLCI